MIHCRAKSHVVGPAYSAPPWHSPGALHPIETQGAGYNRLPALNEQKNVEIHHIVSNHEQISSTSIHFQIVSRHIPTRSNGYLSKMGLSMAFWQPRHDFDVRAQQLLDLWESLQLRPGGSVGIYEVTHWCPNEAAYCCKLHLRSPLCTFQVWTAKIIFVVEEVPSLMWTHATCVCVCLRLRDSPSIQYQEFTMSIHHIGITYHYYSLLKKIDLSLVSTVYLSSCQSSQGHKSRGFSRLTWHPRCTMQIWTDLNRSEQIWTVEKS